MWGMGVVEMGAGVEMGVDDMECVVVCGGGAAAGGATEPTTGGVFALLFKLGGMFVFVLELTLGEEFLFAFKLGDSNWV